MTTLMHYTSEPLVFDPTRIYEQGEPHSYGKPKGLWVSVAGEDDWPSWCQYEECFTDSLVVAHRVTLAASAKVRTIASAFELDAFTGIYTVQTDWERKWPWKMTDRTKWPIDWREVAKDYDGLIIAPYQWSRRMETEWYYGWDCASGCIWNLDAIESVDVVAEQVSS